MTPFLIAVGVIWGVSTIAVLGFYAADSRRHQRQEEPQKTKETTNYRS